MLFFVSCDFLNKGFILLLFITDTNIKWNKFALYKDIYLNWIKKIQCIATRRSLVVMGFSWDR